MLYITKDFQDKYFSELQKSKKPVAIYLKNGKKLSGILLNVTLTTVYLKDVILRSIQRDNIRTIMPV